jgi:signal transduction histidine kinase
MNDADTTPGDAPGVVRIDAIPDPVAGYSVSDTGPVIETVNDAFETVFETGSTEMQIQDWLQRADVDDEALIDELCSSLTGEEGVDIEVVFHSMEGRPAESARYRLRTLGESDPDGELDGYLLLTETDSGPTDAGPSAQVEVDRIASVISHDLRNPLDVAKAHLQAARETGDEEHFDELRQAHDRMQRIIRDVLTLTRGKSALNITADVDPEAVATDAWKTVSTEEASLTVEDDLPRIDADPDRLQRLFENLFRNAVKHGPERANSQSQEQHAEDTAGGSATTEDRLHVTVGSTDGGFFVADDGTGIPAEERDRVFDPGYSMTETGSGTGLGLTIVEEIADAHDWTISLTTGPAGGAQFEFRPRSRDN